MIIYCGSLTGVLHCSFAFSISASGASVEESDQATNSRCAEAKALAVKSLSVGCRDLKPFHSATSLNRTRILAACSALPMALQSLDSQKRASLKKCDVAADKKSMAEATAAAARGLKITSPEVVAGQKAKERIHACADLIRKLRDGNGKKNQSSYVKARDEMIALREENSQRHIKGNRESQSKNPACVAESINFAHVNEKLHEAANALYQAAAARIEATEREENALREESVQK